MGTEQLETNEFKTDLTDTSDISIFTRTVKVPVIKDDIKVTVRQAKDLLNDLMDNYFTAGLISSVVDKAISDGKIITEPTTNENVRLLKTDFITTAKTVLEDLLKYNKGLEEDNDVTLRTHILLSDLSTHSFDKQHDMLILTLLLRKV